MEMQFGPNPKDIPNLLYKLQRKIKVFNTENALPNRGYNLVASSSKYGIVFIGSPDGSLSAYQLKDLIDKECEPLHLDIKLQESPTHIAVSCDQELLAVTGGQILCVFKVSDFKNANVQPATVIKLDASPSTFVSALQWNPCIPDNIALAFFDGTLLVSSVSNNQVKIVKAAARCICWSPKGKQLVTGNSDGSLCQYKPDLTLAKRVPPPNLFEGNPVEALAIYWISTFQFAVVFRNAADNSRPLVTIVNTPKAGQPSCLNYEDICYSMGSNRPWYYYLHGLAQWNVILASSSNSMEIATLGSSDGSNWIQWCQTDEARPELPLTDKKLENYPVGICIDTCGIHQLPWGENDTLPHMPMLLVVSQSGLLTVFNVINLDKSAPQICIPPPQLSLLALPQGNMTREIPGEGPIEVTLPPPPSAAKPQPQQPSAPAPQLQSSQPAFASATFNQQATSAMFAQDPQKQPPAFGQIQQSSAFGHTQQSSVFGQTQSPAFGQTQQVPAFGTTAAPVKQPEPERVEVRPAPSQTTVAAQPKPQPTQAQPSNKPQTSEVNAALKAEQEKMNKLKADQELKSMLVKEVNDFQMELYYFLVKTRETQNKLQQDLNAIDANFNFQTLDAQQLKKECDLEELRNNIVQLKLELVRACAVVAEARAHAEAKDLHQWTQVDPLTNKRVSSVKNLAYYVQTQLEQAHKALDFKWLEMLNNDPQYNKPGQRMIRPILDDVYQPLVKQQEILSRQQAVLRTLKNTLKEIDATPMFRSTTLLRSTPFRNKDPLSKLTKNILNMSLDTRPESKELLTPQKLDALRDMLSNHKPTKIKPVNVELRQHLAQMRISFESSAKEKAKEKLVVVKTEPVEKPYSVKIESQPIKVPTQTVKVEAQSLKVQTQPIKVEAQPLNIESQTNVIPSFKPAMQTDVIKPALVATPPGPRLVLPFTPANQSAKPAVNNVARTLFTNDSASPQTKSILKDMLQNKQAIQEAKNNANTFMGQKICSPSAFAFSSVTQPQQTHPTQSQAIAFASKPISDINNMFSKFTPQSFSPESKVQAQKSTSAETGETFVESQTETKKKEDKPASTFQLKIPSPIAASTPAPEVLKSNQTTSKTDRVASKPDKSKENVPEKVNQNSAPIKFDEKVAPLQKSVEGEKKESAPKAFSFGTNKTTNLTFELKPATSEPSKPLEPKVDVKPELPKEAKKPESAKEENKLETPTSSEISSPTSLFAAALLYPSSPTGEPSKQVEPKVDVKAQLPKEAQKPESTKEENKLETPASSEISSPTSLFSAALLYPSSPTAAKPQPLIETPTSTSQTSIFSTTTPTPIVATTIETKTTGESTPTTVTSPASSLFANAAASQPLAKTIQSGSIFAITSTGSSEFASTQGSIFGLTATTTQSSTQSSPTASPTSTAESVFSRTETKPIVFSTPQPASPAAVFGAAVSAAATTSQSVFGSATVFGAATTQAPSFGSSSVFGTSTTSAATLFGTAAASQSAFATATTTTAQSVFGATTTTTQSIFGSPSSSPSIFGQAAATTQASVFGSPAQTTAQSIFGTATATTTQASIFGTATTASSIFGSTSPTTQQSVFGATSTASVFGSPTPSTQASVFGTPPQTSQASIFGTQATTTAGGSLFGGTENLFAAASISTTSAGSPASGGSIFGGGTTGSVFSSGGSATNVFGGKSAFSQGNPQAAAIFGGASSAAFGQKPATPATNFWSGGSATGGTGFGSTAFGQQATTQASSIFGGSTGGSFSSPSGGQGFGSPQPQGSVFGSPQQQAAPAFGGSSAFGAKPAFGQPAAFGSPTSGGFGGFGLNKSPGGGFGAPASFGGAPTFGGGAFAGSSPGGLFGAAPAQQQPSFGAAPSNSTFEQLATQNTLTFGNLAQQSPQQTQPAPTFNTSPSFTGWRG